MISDGRNVHIVNGYNSDVVAAIKACYQKFKEQPKDHVTNLQGLPIKDQCYAIFENLVSKVRYQVDPDGVQYIKSPARLLADGYGDCKSLSMYICCCLHCLGRKHAFRFVSFDGDNQYTHVYAICWDEQGNEIILDACEKDDEGYTLFDYARPYTKKLDVIY